MIYLLPWWYFSILVPTIHIMITRCCAEKPCVHCTSACYKAVGYRNVSRTLMPSSSTGYILKILNNFWRSLVTILFPQTKDKQFKSGNTQAFLVQMFKNSPTLFLIRQHIEENPFLMEPPYFNVFTNNGLHVKSNPYKGSLPYANFITANFIRGRSQTTVGSYVVQKCPFLSTFIP